MEKNEIFKYVKKPGVFKNPYDFEEFMYNLIDGYQMPVVFCPKNLNSEKASNWEVDLLDSSRPEYVGQVNRFFESLDAYKRYYDETGDFEGKVKCSLKNPEKDKGTFLKLSMKNSEESIEMKLECSKLPSINIPAYKVKYNYG